MMRDGMSVSCLGKTLQDAIRVTASIGLKYIWIDALCIRQDDPGDKAKEIHRMSSFYQAAEVTIIAASARSSNEGFLFNRESSNYITGPFEIPCTFTITEAKGTRIQIAQVKELLSEAITERSWTLQEAWLSKRALIYTTKQLYWSCPTLKIGCGGWESMMGTTSYNSAALSPELGRKGAMVTRLTKPLQPIVSNILVGMLEAGMSLNRAWDGSIEESTTRKLTCPSDKLPVVSAIASHLDPIFRARYGEVVYVAGLWLPRKYNLFEPSNWEYVRLFQIQPRGGRRDWRVTQSELERKIQKPFFRQLLWSADSRRSTRPTNYRAPSFSWASLDGPIQMFDRAAMDTWYESEAQVIGYHVTLRAPSNPFGEVLGAHIVVSGKLKRFLLSEMQEKLEVISAPLWSSGQKSRQSVSICPDTPEDQAIISAGQNLSLFQIIPFHGQHDSPIGLVVTAKTTIRAASASGPVYHRVGLFRFNSDVWWNREEPAEWRAFRMQAFDHDPFEVFTLE